MTPEQTLALLAVIADLRLQVSALAAERDSYAAEVVRMMEVATASSDES